jgi:hypothetical protein
MSESMERNYQKKTLFSIMKKLLKGLFIAICNRFKRVLS